MIGPTCRFLAVGSFLCSLLSLKASSTSLGSNSFLCVISWIVFFERLNLTSDIKKRLYFTLVFILLYNFR